jgi:outer membrane lipoprotein-sorting protein
VTLLARRPLLRWLLPLAAALLLATAGGIVATISASARDSLAPRSAAQLLVDVQNARTQGLSGTVVQTSDLGLPALPNVGGHSSSDFSSMVSGSHTLRLWYGGPTKARLALLGDLGESDLIRNGSDVWLWSSSSNTAKHLTVPAEAGGGQPLTGADLAGQAGMTPQQVADRALKAITPTTTVTTDPTAVVAGRPAYQLVLEPKDTSTLIGSVRIAIDGATHIPTRVQVFPTGGSAPAFEVGFTSFDPHVPPDSVYAFNPPPGATVTEGWGSGSDSSSADHPDRTASESGAHEARSAGVGPPAGSPGTKPTIVGDGWTTVVVATLPTDQTNGGGPSTPFGNLASVIQKLPAVSGGWGSGHIMKGNLFSVLLTDDGRVAAGAVTPEVLYKALSPA